MIRPSKRFALMSLSVAAMTTASQPAPCQVPSTSQFTDAENSLSFDMTDCGSYYAFASACALNINQADPAAQFKVSSENALKLAFILGKGAGMSEAALYARARLSTAKLKEMIDGKCINMAVILEKYKDSCKSFLEHPDQELVRRLHLDRQP